MIKLKFLEKKEFVKELVEKINKKYGKELVTLELKDEYYNMGEIIKDHMYVVDIAKQAMENLGIKPIIKPIRGGTDGSKFHLWDCLHQIFLLVEKNPWKI